MFNYMNTSGVLTSEMIRQKALALGFSDCGFAPVESHGEEIILLREWLAMGMHGEMHYMEKYTDLRENPALLLPDARTMVVLSVNYYPGEPAWSGEDYRLSRYALGEDYHEVIRKKLAQLLASMREADAQAEGRCFVDSGPVMEKAWAQRAGLGWIGKNSLLITRHSGSWVFLAVMLLNRVVAYDDPGVPHCGTCDRCIKACPTGAIVAPGRIDARKCISYLTIEKKGLFDGSVPEWKKWIFGCDACQEVCPWNKKAKITSIEEFLPRKAITDMSHGAWEKLTPEKFSELFRKSAVKRTKPEGLARNILWVKGE